MISLLVDLNDPKLPISIIIIIIIKDLYRASILLFKGAYKKKKKKNKNKKTKKQKTKNKKKTNPSVASID